MNELATIDRRKQRKLEWQRASRKRFKECNGFSDAAHYATGGLRKQVLERDGYQCVKCGMTDHEHKATWSRPITIDHKDKNRKNNTVENLQTLCLTCHGKKDLIHRLRAKRLEPFKEQILRMRSAGATYQQISDEVGFCQASIWKWCGIWNKEQA